MFDKKKMTDTYTLQNGVEIPCLGYGTWQTPTGDVARDSVKAAIDAGYRHIDTAAAYGNEADVGEGIKASGVKREDLFITTKHWIMDRGYSKATAAIDASIKALGCDYLDLYLVHWPCTEKSSPDWKEINAATWRAFEDAYKAGKIRALGVSNYLPEHILALEETAEIKPVVNQIEFHPGYYQPDLVRWSQNHGMLVEAWSPLGCGAVLGNPLLAKLAEKYNKSVAQICIRFALQSGVVPMPKSTHPERIAQNADVFDFEISESDMDYIRMLPPIGYSTYHPAEAPADTLFGGNYDID